MSKILRSTVKQAVLDVLQARPVLTSVAPNMSIPPEISRSYDDSFQGRERIVVGRVKGTTDIYAMGTGANDHFEIEVLVRVDIPGNEVQEAEDRCTALVEDIFDAFKDRTLGGAVDGLLGLICDLREGPDDATVEVGGQVTHSSIARVFLVCDVYA